MFLSAAESQGLQDVTVWACVLQHRELLLLLFMGARYAVIIDATQA